MLDHVQAGGRGVYRFRAVFFSTEEGAFSSMQAVAAEDELARRLSASIHERCALSFVIADSRLLTPENEARELFPRRLIERIVAGAGACSSTMGNAAESVSRRPGRAPLRIRARAAWAEFRKILHRIF